MENIFEQMGNVIKGARNGGVPTGTGPAAAGNLSQLIIGLINVLIVVVSGICFIALALSFIQLMMAQGDPKAVQKAQQAIFWSIIGLIVSLLSYALKIVLLNLLGVTLSESF